MEESLKRLKQARKGAATVTTTGTNGGLTDDGKIRLQLTLDVQYLGEQVGGVHFIPLTGIAMLSTLTKHSTTRPCCGFFKNAVTKAINKTIFHCISTKDDLKHKTYIKLQLNSI